jgi:hypothetical protein
MARAQHLIKTRYNIKGLIQRTLIKPPYIS